MSSTGSVTHWIHQLQAGDQAAVQNLWEGYFRRLVGLARKKLQGVPRRAADEEDVALSAFQSFCLHAEEGQFPRLLDRHDLWQLLMVITSRKAVDLIQHERRQKRGGGKVQLASALPCGDSKEGAAFANLIGREPDPEFAAQVAEEWQRLLDRLGDTDLRRVAVAKMEGHTNDEIAGQIGRSKATVERKLMLIRSIWEREITP
jgi:DNA-directed RNA polymerase specialized sigma24 family protein